MMHMDGSDCRFGGGVLLSSTHFLRHLFFVFLGLILISREELLCGLRWIDAEIVSRLALSYIYNTS
jgi:hypothetical protein